MGDYDLSSEMPPVLVAALISWFVSGCFMEVYGIAIDTIMICFCMDQSCHEPGGYYMSDALANICKIKKGAKAKDDKGSKPEEAGSEELEDVDLLALCATFAETKLPTYSCSCRERSA